MFSADLGVTPSSSTLYAEDVFSTFLYAGSGASLTVTNGIDLAAKGGMVWIKKRSGIDQHVIMDSARGAAYWLYPSATSAQSTDQGTSFTNGEGFNLPTANASTNASGSTYVSWAFRDAPKFFDVVTWVGDGTSLRAINHSLGISPGFIIVKATSSASNWFIAARTSAGTYHRTDGNGNGALNASTAFDAGGPFDFTAFSYVSDTTFTPQVVAGGTVANGNASGVSYVAYLFAHDPSATGLIQCGSFTTDASGASSVTSLGWEPQFLFAKAVSGSHGFMLDTMRGWNMTGADALLRANLTNAEVTTASEFGNPTAAGFDFKSGGASTTYVYIAIRRPNKIPTAGTDVFGLNFSTSGSPDNVIPGLPGSSARYVDFVVLGARAGSTLNASFYDRMRGFQSVTTASVDGYTSSRLVSSSTGAEVTSGTQVLQYPGAGYEDRVMVHSTLIGSKIAYGFKRAPGFFDVVCYTGNGTASNTVNHNLGAAPEFIIIKNRTNTSNWVVQVRSPTIYAFDGVSGGGGALNNSATGASGIAFVNAATTTTFSLSGNGGAYNAADQYVAYLFASLAGISKIDTYTGNGTTQTINCGFAAGARFILIKRLDAAGDWYVWDTARGIVAANDPHLSLNSTAAEVTTDDSVDPVSSGFAVNQLAATNINVSSATYLYFAIA